MWFNGPTLNACKEDGPVGDVTSAWKFELSPDKQTMTMKISRYEPAGDHEALVFTKKASSLQMTPGGKRYARPCARRPRALGGKAAYPQQSTPPRFHKSLALLEADRESVQVRLHQPGPTRGSRSQIRHFASQQSPHSTCGACQERRQTQRHRRSGRNPRCARFRSNRVCRRHAAIASMPRSTRRRATRRPAASSPRSGFPSPMINMFTFYIAP